MNFGAVVEFERAKNIDRMMLGKFLHRLSSKVRRCIHAKKSPSPGIQSDAPALEKGPLATPPPPGGKTEPFGMPSKA